jgi:hypothetical protein
MTLEAIKEAIAELPNFEKTTLAKLLNEQDAAGWDRQIEADFSGGVAGASLLDQWDAEISSGESISLDEFLRSRNRESES